MNVKVIRDGSQSSLSDKRIHSRLVKTRRCCYIRALISPTNNIMMGRYWRIYRKHWRNAYYKGIYRGENMVI
jgi:hypothetical protein